LTREKRAFEIHPQGQVEIFLTYIFRKIFRGQPGIVYEEIEPSEMCGCLFNRAGDLVELRHIHLQSQCPPAAGLNFSCQLFPGFEISQPQRHIGAGMSESQSNGAAKAASRASH
jgi:hypothetical protein